MSHALQTNDQVQHKTITMSSCSIDDMIFLLPIQKGHLSLGQPISSYFNFPQTNIFSQIKHEFHLIFNLDVQFTLNFNNI